MMGDVISMLQGNELRLCKQNMKKKYFVKVTEKYLLKCLGSFVIALS